MNYKPDESTLIAYLYGELGESETEKVELYFKEHPGALADLRSLNDVRNVLGHVTEKEVIAPPVIESDHTVRPLWQMPAVRFAMGMAASLLFLLVAGRLLGPEINYSNGELRISFAKKAESASPPATLTQQQVAAMIEASLAKNNAAQASTNADDQRKLLQTLADINAKKIETLNSQTSRASQEQVRLFVANLQEQNLKIMKDYFQLSTADQKKYTEKLLVDFSSYLQEQRKQDLQFVQSKMNYLEKNNNQFKQETEQILTSLIANPTRKNTNY